MLQWAAVGGNEARRRGENKLFVPYLKISHIISNSHVILDICCDSKRAGPATHAPSASTPIGRANEHKQRRTVKLVGTIFSILPPTRPPNIRWAFLKDENPGSFRWVACLAPSSSIPTDGSPARIAPRQKAVASVPSRETNMISVRAAANLTSNDHEVYEYTGEEEIPEDVVHIRVMTSVIRNGAFELCKRLRTVTVTLPEGGVVIKNNAFCGCESLETIILASSDSYIAKIGNYAFYKCKSLASVELREGLQMIGIYAFQYCSSLDGKHPSTLIS